MEKIAIADGYANEQESHHPYSLIGQIGECLHVWEKYGFWYKRSVPGKDGEPFVPYKIQTMNPEIKIDASGLKYDNLGKIVNDPRVMPVGAFLRRIWVDELGQLINVKRKQMRLVGIRPRSMDEWLGLFTPQHMGRALKRLPGCIGPQYCYAMDPNSPDPIKELERVETCFLDREDHVGYRQVRKECLTRFAYRLATGVKSS